MTSWNENGPPPGVWNTPGQRFQGPPQHNSPYTYPPPQPGFPQGNSYYTQQQHQPPQFISYQHQQPLQNNSSEQTQQHSSTSYDPPPNNTYDQQRPLPQHNSCEQQPRHYQQQLPDQQQYEQLHPSPHQVQYSPQQSISSNLPIRNYSEPIRTPNPISCGPSPNMSWADQPQYPRELTFENDNKVVPRKMLPTIANNTSFEQHTQSHLADAHGQYKQTQQPLAANNFMAEAYNQAGQCADSTTPVRLHQPQWPISLALVCGKDIDAEKSQNEMDKEWVNEWLRQLDKRVVFPAKLTCYSLTIPDAKSFLREALMILKDLSLLHKELSDNGEACADTLWNLRCRRVSTLKARLMEIQSLLIPKEKELTKKLTCIRKKRVRINKRNAALKEQQAGSTQKREDLHQQLDSWLNQIHQEDLRTQREKVLKEEADSILAEVHKKQVESTKASDLIHSLLKLRSLRKDAAQRKGLYTTKESDQLFATKLATLQSILSKQLEDYKGEEKALRVMLESTREAEQMEKQKQFLLKVADKQQILSEYLFGSTEAPLSDNPVYPFWKFYTQAEGSLDTLLNIREEWDSYVVPASASFSSSVPISWVAPEEPTSNNWKKALSDELDAW